MFLWIVMGLVVLFLAIRQIKINHDKKVQWEMQERKKAQEKKEQAHTRNMAQAAQVQTRPTGIDSRDLPSYMSAEERAEIAKIAAHTGNRFVTQTDIHQYILDNLAADFEKMPGWDMWDRSIHQAPGQFERAERGSHMADKLIAEYDPDFQLARVIGESGTYLTSYKSCSCPDFRKRRLPCKHMYALAMRLEGDVSKRISSSNGFPLLNLSFATAGRFPKDGSGETVKDKINALGGNTSDSVSFYSSALILGDNPSENKINKAKDYEMEILSSDMILNLFQTTSENNSTKG